MEGPLDTELNKHFDISGVDTIQAAKKEAKNRKKRQATAIVGDMRPLEDTLPTLELLLRDTPKHNTAQEKWV